VFQQFIPRLANGCLQNRYIEAIPYLYSANTFVISNSDIMEYLPRLLLPQRIDVIRSIIFYWHVYLNPRQVLEQESQETDPCFIGLPGTWNATWANIAAMKSLRILHVKIEVMELFWESLNQDTATRLLQPIKQVVVPKEFVLTLPFPAMTNLPPRENFSWAAVDGWEGRDPWEDLPCTIIRASSRRNLS